MYWMQQMEIDVVATAAFVICAALWTCGMSEVVYFGGWKKFLFYDPVVSRPQLFGQDFVVNFATYTQVYMVMN